MNWQPENNKINKITMWEYEIIRQSSYCNMYDFYCVRRRGNGLDFEWIPYLSLDDYMYLLANFNRLMEYYGIDQSLSIDEMFKRI